ncbi:MAG TPA: flagellar basal body rod C-terminal domain-containing protein [Bryobacteraceae bacterium]|jgi:flagellar basal body rod protein FlgG
MIDLQTPLAGMNRASASVDRAASRIAAAPFASSDSVDLSTEMVTLMEGRTSFEANVKVAQKEDQMSKSVIDLLG